MLRFACAVAVIVLPSGAFAWGSSGHSIVAEIAQRRLTPAASAEVAALVGTASLASISSWADAYKFTPPGLATKPWHFVDIPVGQEHYDGKRDCDKPGEGDCLVAALNSEVSLLADKTRSLDDRRQALKMVVHLAGDLTQPFHCAETLDDAGGNAEVIHLVGKGPGGDTREFSSKLHALWDDGLVDAHEYSWGAYVDELEAKIVPTITVQPIGPDSVTRWAEACHGVGETVYGLMPADWKKTLADGKTIDLPADYQVTVQPIVARQLATGGLQLAEILNAALTGP